MMLNALLLAGATFAGLAGIAGLFGPAYAGMPGIALTLGLLALAFGVWGLKDFVGPVRTGRVGIVLVSFGYGAFATIALLALYEGVDSDAPIALAPLYLLAVLFMVTGFAALALWIGKRPKALYGPALLFALAALLHLLRPFMAGLEPIHGAATLSGALGLAWAALALRRQG